MVFRIGEQKGKVTVLNFLAEFEKLVLQNMQKAGQEDEHEMLSSSTNETISISGEEKALDRAV